MRYAIVDCRVTPKIKKALQAFADKVILLPPYERLSAPVASHPDMLLWCCGGRVVTYREYFEQNTAVFEQLAELEFVFEESTPRSDYPHDIALNCATVGKTLIARLSHLAPAVKGIAEGSGMKIVNTRQGYAKCSTAAVSDNAIITSDPSIEKSARGAGLDVLHVREGYVALDGYGTGFIGGASGTAESAVLFCGDLDLHPDAAAIRAFCRRHGKEAISLSDEPLYDYGTVLLLEI